MNYFFFDFQKLKQTISNFFNKKEKLIGIKKNSVSVNSKKQFAPSLWKELDIQVWILKTKIGHVINKHILTPKERKIIKKKIDFWLKIPKKSLTLESEGGKTLMRRVPINKCRPYEKILFFQEEKKQQIQPPMKVPLFRLEEPSLKEKKIVETRRRLTSTKLLDAVFDQSSYFHFFSEDAFKAVKDSKFMAQVKGDSEVSLFLLFAALLNYRCSATREMRNYGIKFGKVQKSLNLVKKNRRKVFSFSWFPKILKNLQGAYFEIFLFCSALTSLTNKQRTRWIKAQIQPFEEWEWENVEEFSARLLETFNNWVEEISENGVKKFKAFFSLLDSSEDLPLSPQVFLFFEKAAENTFTRFKGASVSLEVLLLTFMEEESIIKKMMELMLRDKVTFFLLRYELIKMIYDMEVAIRNLPSGQRMFAYLLKNHSSDQHFRRLIWLGALKSATNMFRNLVVSKVLESDINPVQLYNVYNSVDFYDTQIHSSYSSKINKKLIIRKELVQVIAPLNKKVRKQREEEEKELIKQEKIIEKEQIKQRLLQEEQEKKYSRYRR